MLAAMQVNLAGGDTPEPERKNYLLVLLLKLLLSTQTQRGVLLCMKVLLFTWSEVCWRLLHDNKDKPYAMFWPTK